MTEQHSTLILTTPGLFARRLVADWKARGESACLLLLPNGDSPRAAVEELDFPCLEGDPRAIDWGLSGKKYLQLVREVRRIVVALSPPLEEPKDLEQSALVRASAEVLEFVRAGGAPEGVTALSSLLVFGDASGLCTEEDFQVGQSLQGLLEESLAVSEKLLREARKRVPVKVVRVAPLLGDALTGEEEKQSLLRAWMRQVELAPSSLELSFEDRPLLYETVDRASAALQALLDVRESLTTHLVDNEPPTDREVLLWWAERTGRSLSEWAPGSRNRRTPHPLVGMSHPLKRAFGQLRPRFARTQAERHFPELLDRPWGPVWEKFCPSVSSSSFTGPSSMRPSAASNAASDSVSQEE